MQQLRVKDWKFDPRAGLPLQELVFSLVLKRQKDEKESLDFRNKGRKGRVVYSSQFWSDPTFFPFRNAGRERVTSLSCGVFLSGKKTSKTELPVPDCYEEWIRQAHEETLSTQQIQAESESGDHESDSQSEKTEIVGYDKSTGRYSLGTAGEISYVDASEGAYQAIVDSLMYLYRWTRPDLGFAVTFFKFLVKTFT